MAELISSGICLGIKPLYFARLCEGPTGWKYYEISVMINRADDAGERRIPLFNSELLGNPFIERTDTNSISYIFDEALKTREIVHFEAFEEMNIYISIYPSTSWQTLKLPLALTAHPDDFMVVFQLEDNTFTHDGYSGDGPALVMYVERHELEAFYKQLYAEELEAFSKKEKPRLSDGTDTGGFLFWLE